MMARRSRAETIPAGIVAGDRPAKQAARPERIEQMKELNISEKITAAREYAKRNGQTEEAKNDAANICADSYAEYLIIWEALNK